MANLETTYMGLQLKHPIVPSASPLSRELDDIKAMEDAGAAAIVLYSLFEEQIALGSEELAQILSEGSLSLADATLYFPHKHEYPRDPEAYVEHVRKAKEAVDIPIIASLNGISKGNWLEYAHKIEQAGADGLELNVYFIPTTDNLFGLDIETLYLDICKAVKGMVSIPIAMKLSPFFSALPNFAGRLEDAGADSLVLFNRFYQPNINVEQKRIEPQLALSTSEDLLLPLRWVAILRGQLECSLAITSGVHSAKDVLKAILAGADVAHVCSLLLREGIGKLKDLVEETARLMDALEMESVANVKGNLSLDQHAEPTALERASYIKLLQDFKRI